jgi:hypothetical protein
VYLHAGLQSSSDFGAKGLSEETDLSYSPSLQGFIPFDVPEASVAPFTMLFQVTEKAVRQVNFTGLEIFEQVDEAKEAWQEHDMAEEVLAASHLRLNW